MATVIIGQHVRDEHREAFAAWQNQVNDVVRGYPGFLGTEVTPPTAVQPDWVVIYRFDSVVHAQNWLNSAARQDLLNRGAAYHDGPATQQVLARGGQPRPALMTVVVTHRVKEEDTQAFLEWQQRLLAAEREVPGFRGSEIFRPVAGVQDEWTALYRFDSATSLDAWLTSARRKQLLEEGREFDDFQLRTVDNSFGNWFAFDERGDDVPPPPSNAKSSLAVWLGLYPTVMVLSLGLAWLLPGLPLWQSLLIGNLLSSFVMSYLTMPHYANPMLRWWLRPPAEAPQPRTDLLGIGLVVAVNAVWAVVFCLLTERIWTLP
ncbi:antibiotic biosynthesis monooxygenase [Pseudonocardia humida]|uniref:Antibiotic biosynthesis monooxygenase n=1 Tax=Pseudonocardia humida TaxID=2800819 RepID=A0ABT1A8L9_9PSEU|nr:antibiotic biosynthesis monooxygenase [Pseudonocardia humida]MCO1659362.1 antibiotic biosynthesis monooxygenase [Pseudonocardia humida]